MGIKLLNKFLRTKCSNRAIRNISFADLHGQTISVDASIYMYKCLENACKEKTAENKEIDFFLFNMQDMIDCLVKHNITPLFVFDGKPPPEKKEVLYQRKCIKRQAQANFLVETDPTLLQKWKHQSIQLTTEHIDKVKQLLQQNKIEYFESPTEADPLCVHLVQTNKAWGCLTEDMDVFGYGCPRVLRNMDLTTKQFTYYHLENILKELNLSQEYFREILVLSGTDYNLLPITNTNTNNLYRVMQMFDIFRKTASYRSQESFYSWLLQQKNIKHIEIQNVDFLRHCVEMFHVSYCKEIYGFS
jgi:hypothetical protein